jgi:NADPH-dependent ferric siderophore reductase
MSFTLERVRFPLRPRLLTVRAVEDLAPWMRRITLVGDLHDFASQAPDDHIKLVFARPGEATIALPTVSADGLGPDRSALPPMRDYTPRRFDPVAGSLTVDMVLHGDGPGSRWAASAAPGTVVGQLGPRGSARLVGRPDWLLLAGDEAAVPAIARRIQALQGAVPLCVRIEGPAPGALGDELQALMPVGADFAWVVRGDARPGIRLVEAVERLALPAGDGYAWVGCEAQAARRLRAHLRGGRGLAKASVKATGYWRAGVSDYHDAPDEV